jgi:hypothetical protein
MVGRWGMSDAVGPLAVLPSPGQESPLGLDGVAPATKELVDREVRRTSTSATTKPSPPWSRIGSSSTGWHTRCSRAAARPARSPGVTSTKVICTVRSVIRPAWRISW